jgi:hypothetical protein
MWDLWWMKWQWDRFSTDVSVCFTRLNLQSSPLTYDKQLIPGDVTAKVILFHNLEVSGKESSIVV